MVKQIDILEGKTKDMDPLLDALFESNKKWLIYIKGFKLEKFVNDQSRDEEKIDIQDLVVSLTILAHMHTEMKLECLIIKNKNDSDFLIDRCGWRWLSLYRWYPVDDQKNRKKFFKRIGLLVRNH